MRAWSRCPVETLCGKCTHPIAVGDPLFTISASGWRKERCRACADEPMPADLPPLVEHPSVAELAPMAPARVLAAALPFDWRKRAANEREPGEEG